MENWQQNVITSELDRLIQLIICNTGLLSRLIKNKIISLEEKSKLTETNCTSQQANMLLLDTLRTRINGYNALIQALHETRHTGAWEVLSVHALLHLPIQRLGEVQLLCELFPKFTKADAVKVLQDSEMCLEFFKIMEKEGPSLSLDGERFQIDNTYIPRSISNRLLLDPRVFKLNCVDIFVFQDISRQDLSRLVKPHCIRSSNNQLSKITCRHIFLNDKRDWHDMTLVTQKPMHLVSKVGEEFVLQQSTEVSESILPYTSNKWKHKQAYISEDKFVDEIVANHVSTTVLLCDSVGSGKTWLMQSIAIKLQKKSKKSIVCFRKLSLVGKVIGELDNLYTGQDAMFCLLNSTVNSKLASYLLQQHIALNPCNVIFVLDGMDEIRENHVERTITFLKKLINLDNVQVIISSRPVMRKYLIGSFRVVSYDILPFERKEQAETIVQNWMQKFPTGNHHILSDLAKGCIDAVKIHLNVKSEIVRNYLVNVFEEDPYSLYDLRKDLIDTIKMLVKGESDILGYPLMCFLLSVVNEVHAHQLCSRHCPQNITISDLAKFDSVTRLFEKFARRSMQNAAERWGYQNESTDLEKKVSICHTFKALEALFPTIGEAFKMRSGIDTSIANFVMQVGLLTQKENGKEGFTHASFANYFAGKFFAQFWTNVAEYKDQPELRTKVAFYFINKGLVTVDREVCTILTSGQLEVRFGNTHPNFQFKNNIISIRDPVELYFMNSMYKSEHSTGHALIFQGMNEISVIRALTDFMMQHAYFTLLACIDFNLTSVLTLFVQLIKSFVPEKERHRLFFPSTMASRDIRKYNENCVPLILCRVAASGAPELAEELFKLFGESEETFLLKFCRNYPENLLSPLEIAIYWNDIDMVEFFADKITRPLPCLFLACMAKQEYTEIEDIEARLKIIDRVLDYDEQLLEVLNNTNLSELGAACGLFCHHNLRIEILTRFVWKRRISANTTSTQNKQLLFEVAFLHSSDKEIIRLLLWLFGKQGFENHEVTKTFYTEETELGSTCRSWREVTAQQVLDILDIELTRETLTEVGFYSYDSFGRIEHMETLKMLAGIGPDSSEVATWKWNFLHKAVFSGKLDWAKYLIKSGHDVNRADGDGNTPIHLLGDQFAVEMTRLLVRKGAKVDAVNQKGETAAHTYFGRIDNLCNFEKIIPEWVSYMLRKNYITLWNMKDNEGNTPLELLQYSAGADHPTTKTVQSLLHARILE